MSSSVIRSKGQITIPSEIRKAANLQEGDPIELEVVEGGILLKPSKVIDATQAWYWLPAWQEGEREAAADLAEGRSRTFESSDDFLASLEQD